MVTYQPEQNILTQNVKQNTKKTPNTGHETYSFVEDSLLIFFHYGYWDEDFLKYKFLFPFNFKQKKTIKINKEIKTRFKW